MAMNRISRIATGWIGIAALVFAQLAVSAYACPNAGGVADMQVAQASEPCHQSGMDESNLCSKHCHDSEQGPSSLPLMHAAFVAAFIAVVVVPASGASIEVPGNPALLHPPSPPASLRNCCLRI
jgi:hypothetical protein